MSTVLRMESKEMCNSVIAHFNGKFIKTAPGTTGKAYFLLFSHALGCDAHFLVWLIMTIMVRTMCFFPSPAPSEPLLCKFADGQRKRHSHSPYIPSGRTWPREGELRLVSASLSVSFVWMSLWVDPQLQVFLSLQD